MSSNRSALGALDGLEALVGPEGVTRTVDALENAIGASFLRQGGTMTRSAVKDRLDFCLSILGQALRDQKWSLARSLDGLPRWLRMHLLSVPIDLDAESKHGAWGVDDEDAAAAAKPGAGLIFQA